MLKDLAKKLLDEKKNKATEMVGVKIILENQLRLKVIPESIDEKEKTATFIMSTCDIDRHGEVVDQDSWNLEYFNKAPRFFLQHRSDKFPIGKWLEVWFENDPNNAGKKMMVGKAKFSTDINEDADEAFKHLVAGNMDSVSVGFIPHRVEYDEHIDAFVLYDCELLECSFVGIGSNRQAQVKEKPETEIKDIKEIAIDAKELLEDKINITGEKTEIRIYKAREFINKAIRRMNN